MAKRLITKQWTEQDVVRLIALADQGATLLRASAALGRPTQAVQKKARLLGRTFPGVRAVKAKLRELDRIE